MSGNNRYLGASVLRKNKEFLRRFANNDPVDALKDELDMLIGKSIRSQRDNFRIQQISELLKLGVESKT
jgi:hypothetical protein